MKNTRLMSRRASQRRLPTLVAVGSSLAALPAMAIELGDLTVHSSLGQPLRASIAYALAPAEQLFSDCISLRSGATASGLPNVGRATISVANGVIKISGNSAIREPMVAAHLMVNCSYSANISREYMLFIDPQAPTWEAPGIVEQTTTPVAKTVVAVASVRPGSVTRSTVEKNVGPAAPYQVRAGDSVSLIAQRIENRGIGLWAAIDAIFAANPNAFIDNDPNKLKAGVWLTIPNFASNESTLSDVAPRVSDVVIPPAPTDFVENTAVGTDIAVDEIAVDVTTADLQPGNIVVEDNAFAAVPAKAEQNSGSPAWWMWLAGGGIAIALALTLFGRRSRTRPDTTDTEQLAVANVDYNLSDDSPTAENELLDADLILAAGLDNAAAPRDSKSDIELTLDSSQSILESEILPVDGDYDMSIIIDATKIPRPEEVTECDLKAVIVDTDDETMIADSYTIDREVDFQVLEQDYEDEMTATQALNEEITRAAAELASQMDDHEDAAPGDEPAVLKLATVTELDATSHLPVQHDTIGDDEDTGINEMLTENMPVEDSTVEMPAAENDEKTVDMPIRSGKVG